MIRSLGPVVALALLGCEPRRVPPSIDAASGADRRALPDPRRAGGAPVFEVIAQRRSRRAIDPRPLADADLGQLLWAAQGVTDAEGHRAAPSAGALYPLTLWVADADGVWRYLPGAHALVRTLADDRRDALAAAGLGQAPLAAAPVVVIVAGAEAVTARKYGERAPRYVALEAGHAAQNLLLAATALDLAAVPIGAFDDAEVTRALGLARDATPLYLIPVGGAAAP